MTESAYKVGECVRWLSKGEVKEGCIIAHSTRAEENGSCYPEYAITLNSTGKTVNVFQSQILGMSDSRPTYKATAANNKAIAAIKSKAENIDVNKQTFHYSRGQKVFDSSPAAEAKIPVYGNALMDWWGITKRSDCEDKDEELQLAMASTIVVGDKVEYFYQNSHQYGTVQKVADGETFIISKMALGDDGQFVPTETIHYMTRSSLTPIKEFPSESQILTAFASQVLGFEVE